MRGNRFANFIVWWNIHSLDRTILREVNMAKSDKPSASTQDKPTSSLDDLVKSGKKGSTELTEDELKKVSGGALDAYISVKGSPQGHS